MTKNTLETIIAFRNAVKKLPVSRLQAEVLIAISLHTSKTSLPVTAADIHRILNTLRKDYIYLILRALCSKGYLERISKQHRYTLSPAGMLRIEDLLIHLNFK